VEPGFLRKINCRDQSRSCARLRALLIRNIGSSLLIECTGGTLRVQALTGSDVLLCTRVMANGGGHGGAVNQDHHADEQKLQESHRRDVITSNCGLANPYEQRNAGDFCTISS